MANSSQIRIKTPSKTDTILEYFAARPNRTITPSEVAKDLGYDLQTTITIINRLAFEGAILKEKRGIYKSKRKMDDETIASIYETLYESSERTLGTGVLKIKNSKTKITLESIKTLVSRLEEVIGKDATKSFITVTLRTKLSEEEITNTLHILGVA